MSRYRPTEGTGHGPGRRRRERRGRDDGRAGSRALIPPRHFLPPSISVPPRSYGLLLLIVATLLLGLLFYQTREVLSPVVLALVVALLLWPFRRERKIRPLLVAGGIVLLLWFFVTAFAVIFPFLLAFLFAYIADPLVTWASRRWYISRNISSLVLTVMALGILGAAIVYALPLLLEQIRSALISLTGVGTSLVEWARSGELSSMTGIGQDEIELMIRENVLPLIDGVDKQLLRAAGGAAEGIVGAFESVLQFIMIPFLTFYFVRDYWKIRTGIYSFFPQEYQRRGQRLLRDVHEVFGGYLRGDLITSVAQGTMIGVGLHFIGVPGALLLGIVSGFLNLIPLLGSYIAWAICIVFALTTPDPLITSAWVTGLFAVQAVFEATVIAPQIIGRHTDLHPAMVIVSLAVFGYFMGLLGMLIAIPSTSLVMRWLMRWRDERRARIEEEKVARDVERNPSHARRGTSSPPTPAG